ncbi:hypothetical protein [Streptomyces netropsis]|uniref:Neuraminidase (Sialidase) n=1 Tax=Streptomyces netropsis TaxID=55404 RepID=A0A7W7LD15_STRNE|nr:hypothetical protein [Streptomyces netropsis]MBB4887964.1 hypothetical protein [Streptomyces netropsis]GGR33048.1 hypothetical protein GCM10010219_42430 [Streptomyces netropsis]
MHRRLLRNVLHSVIAMLFACTGSVLISPAAHAAAACAGDSNAQGLASRPASGSLVSVTRADGRVEQFQQFYDNSSMSGLPFVWHRAQDVAGGSYGDWERVSAVPAGPKLYQVVAAENSIGGLEAFIPSYGRFCHTVLPEPDGQWGPAEDFGLQPAPYHGGIVLFKERDGRLHAFASSGSPYTSMDVRSQYSSSDGHWADVRWMGKVPEADVGLSSPTSVTQLADGRLHIVAREWNRDRYWQTTERDRFLSWEPWQLCANAACT